MSSVNMAIPELARSTNGWPPIGDRSLSGRQIDCLLLNTGNRLKNVASQVGIRDPWDGRAVALIDIDNNGALDLLVTVQGGGASSFLQYHQPRQALDRLSVTR